MKEPKTIKQYIKMVKLIESTSLLELKGFDKLSSQAKRDLVEFGAIISNHIDSVKIKE